MNEANFPNGIRFEKPKEGTPEFIKGRISINVPDFITWLDSNKNERGWVNIDLKKSKGGKLYLQLNDYNATRGSKLAQNEEFYDEINPDSIDL